MSAWTQGFLLGCAVGFIPWLVLMLLVLLEHRRERNRRPGYVFGPHVGFIPELSHGDPQPGGIRPTSINISNVTDHARQHGVTTPNTGKETL
jgi:hypothetical protein